MKCPFCYSDVPTGAARCPTCKAPFAGEAIPPALAREDAERRRALMRDRAARRETHTIRTTIVGAVLFGVLGSSLSGVRLFNSARRHLSHVTGASAEGADERSLWTGFFLAIPVAAVLGAAAGYVIGKRELRMAGGAVVGAALFAFGSALLSSPVIVRSGSPLVEALFAAGLGIPAGAIIGALLGYHAKSAAE